VQSPQISRRIEEQLRRVSSRTTEQIARRYGQHFPMWIGCGFPKSGTVWLCKLLSSYLGVPYPQNYGMPIAMRAVVHAHWDYHPGLPTVAYIHRDGRDVMVSLYFHQMKQLELRNHPRSAHQLDRRFRSVFGRDFDPRDVRGNLPRFIDAEFRQPAYMRRTWPAHIDDWLGLPRPNVHAVSYEALKQDTESAFGALMTAVLEVPADPHLVALAVARNDFETASGRTAGTEDRADVMRKGIVGDWRNHFSPEAGEVFEMHAGNELRLLGYEPDHDWVDKLSS
jgi:Sulfotransferase domain